MAVLLAQPDIGDEGNGRCEMCAYLEGRNAPLETGTGERVVMPSVPADRPQSRVLRRAIFKAVTNGAALAAGTITAFTALLLGSGLLGLLALGGYLVGVAIDLSRPRRWREAIEHVRSESVNLPPATMFSADATREVVLRLERARTARICALEVLPASTKNACRSLLEKPGALEEAAVQMLPVLDRVCCHLVTNPIEASRLEMMRIERAAAVAPPSVQADYERALEVVADRLRLLEHSEQLRAALLGRLEVVLCELESLPTALVALDLQQTAGRCLEEPAPAPGLLQDLQAIEEAANGVLPAPASSTTFSGKLPPFGWPLPVASVA
jgi:hypothetical protein